MTTLEALIAPVRHSHQLLEAVKLLEQQLAEEKRLRKKFYLEITSEEKVEFINGEIIHHAPAQNRHLDATGLLFRLLSTFVDVQKSGAVKSEKCLCTFPRNDYEPDIVFFSQEKAAELHPDTLKFPVPDLVVEVLSSSTEQRDRGVKFEDYAAHGVGEYWIIDTDQQVVEQYILEGENFELKTKGASGELASEVIQGFCIPVVAIFDEKENLNALGEMLQG